MACDPFFIHLVDRIILAVRLERPCSAIPREGCAGVPCCVSCRSLDNLRALPEEATANRTERCDTCESSSFSLRGPCWFSRRTAFISPSRSLLLAPRSMLHASRLL